MDEAKIPRIIGKSDGWTPITELEHFIAHPVAASCSACGGWINRSRTGMMDQNKN